MALIHTFLYRGERFDRVDMGSYLKELVDYLSQTFGTKSTLVTPVIEPSEVYLSMTEAVPCALVLNEVISNAFRHAFKEGQKGTIKISLKGSPKDRILIRVKDDGIGMPEEIDLEKANSLGLRLVRTIVREQLMGEIRLNRDHGTEIFVEFSVLNKEDSNA
jgi:two-component sensor histidine kinase